MSIDADAGDGGPEPPAVVLDDLAIYDTESPEFDFELVEKGRKPADHKRVWLVFRLSVSLPAIEGVTGPTRTLGIYATTDGAISIRWSDDLEAQIHGILAHSLLEPEERIRRPEEPEFRELFANRVAAIDGDSHE